ncbi:unnamed protein product [Caenorhabditis nigoni]
MFTASIRTEGVVPFPPSSSNIYTDWANRHLSKGALSRPIRDISNEFRDYRLVSQLINVIVPINEYSPTYTKKLAKITSNLDGLETCLDYLKNLGLDCSKLTKTG